MWKAADLSVFNSTVDIDNTRVMKFLTMLQGSTIDDAARAGARSAGLIAFLASPLGLGAVLAVIVGGVVYYYLKEHSEESSNSHVADHPSVVGGGSDSLRLNKDTTSSAIGAGRIVSPKPSRSKTASNRTQPNPTRLLTAIERNVSATFPTVVLPDSTHELRFTISPTSIETPIDQLLSRGDGLLTILYDSTSVSTLEFLVTVDATDFDIVGPDGTSGVRFRRFVLDPRKSPSDFKGKFRLRAHGIQTTRSSRIYVRFSVDNLPAGQIDLPVVVSSSTANISARSTREQNAGQLSLASNQAPGPDVVFHVNKRDEATFDISVDRRIGPERFDNEPLGAIEFSESADKVSGSFLRDFKGCLDLPPAQREGRVLGVGATLWSALPTDFKNFYWEQMEGQELSVAFNSQEPYIPWELLVPQPKTKRSGMHKPLGVQFAIGRWRQRRPYPNPLVVTSFVAMAPEYGKNPLHQAAKEVEELRMQYGVRVIPGELAHFTKLWREEEFNALHFAGHGRFDPVYPDNTMIALSDHPLRLSDLQGKVSSSRPLVFLNACETGGTGWGLTQIGGWADAFCDAGSNAFIGPYWAVDDEVAKRAALLFYEQIRSGRTLGQTMQDLRSRFWLDEEHRYHPTWLAYSLHCHPNVTVSFQL